MNGRAILQVMRAHSALGAALLVPLGGIWGGEAYLTGRWIAPAILAFLLAAWGNVDNDLGDVELDRHIRPKRPLPSGQLSKAAAHRLAQFLLAAALGMACWLGTVALLGTSAALLLTRLYNRHLKRAWFLGPALVGMLTMWPLAYGGLLAGHLTYVLTPGILIAALFSAREVIKTIHDAPGDRQAGIPTVTVRFGIPAAFRLTAFWQGIALGAAYRLPQGRFLGIGIVLLWSSILALAITPSPEQQRLRRVLHLSKGVGLLLILMLLVGAL